MFFCEISIGFVYDHWSIQLRRQVIQVLKGNRGARGRIRIGDEGQVGLRNRPGIGKMPIGSIRNGLKARSLQVRERSIQQVTRSRRDDQTFFSYKGTSNNRQDVIRAIAD